MDFKDKYLKYKSKYLALKKQLGGFDTWEEFKQASNRQVATYEESVGTGNLNINCPNSYYNYTGADIDKIKRKCKQHNGLCGKLGHQYSNYGRAQNCLICLKDKKLHDELPCDESKDIKKTINVFNRNFIKSPVCQPIDGTTSYFKQSPDKFNSAINIENPKDMISGDNMNQVLLDMNRYSNQLITNQLILDKDLICLEGNILYGNSGCKVASGGITTCLFMIFVLDDNSFIACHMNGLLTSARIGEMEDPSIREFLKYKFSQDNCFRYIRSNYPQIRSLKKIFITGILNNYEITNNFPIDSRKIDIRYSANPENPLDQMLNTNKRGVCEIIKSKLGVSPSKLVELNFKQDDFMGNYIYANNKLYQLDY